MTDITWVQWERAGNRSERSRWHIATDTLHDDLGRTGCGRRYRRKGATYESDHHIVDISGDLCKSCLRAYNSQPENWRVVLAEGVEAS